MPGLSTGFLIQLSLLSLSWPPVQNSAFSGALLLPPTKLLLLLHLQFLLLLYLFLLLTQGVPVAPQALSQFLTSSMGTLTALREPPGAGARAAFSVPGVRPRALYMLSLYSCHFSPSCSEAQVSCFPVPHLGFPSGSWYRASVTTFVHCLDLSPAAMSPMMLRPSAGVPKSFTLFLLLLLT